MDNIILIAVLHMPIDISITKNLPKNHSCVTITFEVFSGAGGEERLFSAISLSNKELKPPEMSARGALPFLTVEDASWPHEAPAYENSPEVPAQSPCQPRKPVKHTNDDVLIPPVRHLRVETSSPSSMSRRSLQSPAAASSSAYSDVGDNVMTETRDDLLQGIKAMDDSIQTLKAEMNKLLSVYECVRLQPEQHSLTHKGVITYTVFLLFVEYFLNLLQHTLQQNVLVRPRPH